MSNIVIGWDQGTYTPNAGTRQITLSGLDFTPSVTGLLYVHNYTQKTTYFAQAQSYDKEITFTADGADWIMEYQDFPTFDVLGANDIIHIQFDQITNSDHPINITITDPSTGDEAGVNEDGQLHVVLEGHLCDCNSSTTPLLADAVYTGESKDILSYNAISVFVTSDVASAISGLEIQYSADGSTNWRTAEEYTILAGAEKWFSPPSFGKYFRVVYTNGASDQTSFELTTIMRKTPFKWSSHNIDMPITDQDDATLTKSVITGKKANGDYDNVSLTNGGNMKVSLEELESGISSNSNSQLNVTSFHADGTEGNLITGVKKETGKDGIDSSTNTLQTIDYAHHEIHGGSTYRVQVNDPAIGNGGEISISFYVPDTAVLPHVVWEFVHSGSMCMSVLEGTTITVSTGSDVLCKNSRRDAGDTSILQGTATGALVSNYVTTNATYSGGTIISLKYDYAAKNAGGGGVRRNEIILKRDTYYTFVLDNLETTTQGGQIRLEYYEHQDKN